GASTFDGATFGAAPAAARSFGPLRGSCGRPHAVVTGHLVTYLLGLARPVTRGAGGSRGGIAVVTAATTVPLLRLDRLDQLAFAHPRRAGYAHSGGELLELGEHHAGKAGGALARPRCGSRLVGGGLV